MAADFKKILHDCGYKATSSRFAILKAFSKIDRPMNAEAIYQKVKKTGLDKVTVYRTIASFEKSGILRRIDLKKNSSCYELNNDHHHHVICTECDKIVTFKEEDDKKIIDSILEKVKVFKTISGHTFDLFGICKNCSKK